MGHSDILRISSPKKQVNSYVSENVGGCWLGLSRPACSPISIALKVSLLPTTNAQSIHLSNLSQRKKIEED